MPMPPPTGRTFLSAQWRALAMLNWRVPTELVQPYVPRGVELDFFGGATYLSVVGFYFSRTRLLGLPIPGHTAFPEVNLRFYVRRTVGEEVRRGVCFVRELVPRWAIARVAQWAYNEPYVSLPMQHSATPPELAVDDVAHDFVAPRASYSWSHEGQQLGLSLSAAGRKTPLAAGSEAEFIAEHYWGYCRQRDGGTVEYQVTHPRWNAWEAEAAELQGDVAGFYGEPFAAVLRRPCDSAFLADGSAIRVLRPQRIA